MVRIDQKDLPDCPQCKELGQKSVVRFRGNGSTMLGVHRFRDEQGHHIHDPNTKTITYSCNKGHKWNVSYKESCPNKDCNYNKNS
jgi:hypothetical protein